VGASPEARIFWSADLCLQSGRVTADHTFFLQCTDESLPPGPGSVRGVCISCEPRGTLYGSQSWLNRHTRRPLDPLRVIPAAIIHSAAPAYEPFLHNLAGVLMREWGKLVQVCWSRRVERCRSPGRPRCDQKNQPRTYGNCCRKQRHLTATERSNSSKPDSLSVGCSCSAERFRRSQSETTG